MKVKVIKNFNDKTADLVTRVENKVNKQVVFRHFMCYI